MAASPPGSTPALRRRPGQRGRADPARGEQVQRLQPLEPQRAAAQLAAGQRPPWPGRPAARPGPGGRSRWRRRWPRRTGTRRTPAAPARSTSTPCSSAAGGLRNRHTETRLRSAVAPPAPVPSRMPLPSSPGVASGRPPRQAGACSRIIARLAANPPAAITTPRRAPTRSGRPCRRSSPATGRCSRRPSLGAYR